MDKFIKITRYFDFAGALAALGWAIHSESLLWAGAGVLGLVFAWLSPASKLNNYAQKRLLGRSHSTVSSRTTLAMDLPEAPQPLPSINTNKPDFNAFRKQGIWHLRHPYSRDFSNHAHYFLSKYGKTNK